MRVPLRHLLEIARTHRFAVGAFNVHSIEGAQAVLEAARREKAPVILSTSEGGIAHLGLAPLAAGVAQLLEAHPLPVAYHFDHGKDLTLLKEAIKSGWYDSVMIDASSFPYITNVRQTKRLVAYAHDHGINVEAEIGRIQGVEDRVKSLRADETDPQEAQRFVEQTGCDVLAIAVGTRHGVLKWFTKPKLNIELISEIRDVVNTPLVLHGASTLSARVQRQLRTLGVNLVESHGTSDRMLQKAIQSGISKINVDSDLRLAWHKGMRMHLKKNPDDLDPRHALAAARDVVTETVQERLRIFGASKKAHLYV